MVVLDCHRGRGSWCRYWPCGFATRGDIVGHTEKWYRRFVGSELGADTIPLEIMAQIWFDIRSAFAHGRVMRTIIKVTLSPVKRSIGSISVRLSDCPKHQSAHRIG